MFLEVNDLLNVIYLVLAFVLIYLIFLIVFILIIDKVYFDRRIEPKMLINNPSHKQCGILNKDNFSFYSGKNKLNGGIYYNNEKSTSEIAIFMHGFGGGHEGYFPEISFLVKQGYKVYAFDSTATVASEGKKFRGAPQMIKDLKYCIEEVQKQNPNKKILLMGHSMGAYSVINVLHLCNVEKVVAISPFNNMSDVVYDRVYSKLGKNLFLLKTVYKVIQRIKFGKIASYRSFETLKYVNKEVLVIQGSLDKVVLPNLFMDSIVLNHNAFVKYLIFDDKYHHPLLSNNAIAYNINLKHIIDELKFKYKEIPVEEIKRINNIVDYKIKNELDEKVLREIELFIKR